MTIKLIDHVDRNYFNKITNYDDPPFFTDEAIEMIKKYISPYISELEAVENGNFMEIIDKYPKRIRDHVLVKRVQWHHFNEGIHILSGKYSIQEAAQIIMYQFIDSIIVSDNNRVFNSEEIIDPWVVAMHFRSSKDLRELFHLKSLTNKGKLSIDVDVIINDIKYTHPMSKELVWGIITYYKNFELNHPLSLCGKTFIHETRYICPLSEDAEICGYVVRVGTNRYSFNNDEFMRGLITASQWITKDNPHKYITELKQHTKSSTEIFSQLEEQNNIIITPLIYQI